MAALLKIVNHKRKLATESRLNEGGVFLIDPNLGRYPSLQSMGGDDVERGLIPLFQRKIPPLGVYRAQTLLQDHRRNLADVHAL